LRQTDVRVLQLNPRSIVLSSQRLTPAHPANTASSLHRTGDLPRIEGRPWSMQCLHTGGRRGERHLRVQVCSLPASISLVTLLLLATNTTNKICPGFNLVTEHKIPHEFHWCQHAVWHARVFQPETAAKIESSAGVYAAHQHQTRTYSSNVARWRACVSEFFCAERCGGYKHGVERFQPRDTW
jgi:hypothetical protein